MKSIVTGGTGFLGNALVRELVENGDDVTALVRPNSKRIDNVKSLSNVKIIECDLNNEIVLPDVKYDVFYHLAWEGGRNDFESQYQNINITLNCLRCASKYGCKSFICTGSQAEYGEVSDIITEDTPLNPATSYGAAKVAAYFLSKDLAKQLNINHIWVRVFSVYGENDNPNTLYSNLTKAMKEKTNFKMDTDGTHMWNFLHESDAARALRLIGNSDINCGVYNLASKDCKPLHEYVDIIRKKINFSSIITYGNEKSKVNLNVSTDKLLNEIGEFENTKF